jgi:hypothetical protein
MGALSKIFTTAVIVFATACGGSSDSPPGPLGKHYDDMHIAQVPLDQKGAVVQTQQDWSVAKMENAKAEADYNEMTQKLAVVRNDAKGARLKLDSAISNKKSAEASNDTNKTNTAQRDVRNAELLVKAADARVKYHEIYRGYLKKYWRYTQENMYWREAQYENAKADLGKKNNVAPKGLSYDAFPQQEQQRNKRTASAKAGAESEKGRAQSARDNWLKLQQEADQANGTPSQFPDPMVQSVTPTTASP